MTGLLIGVGFFATEDYVKSMYPHRQEQDWGVSATLSVFLHSPLFTLTHCLSLIYCTRLVYDLTSVMH